ncbi:hypothetical protein [Micromonospora aurantiaca (nom. illeg.)]|uniref:hypothetical protein n=1 Tax=Micromonospora aurantiaca (nom. illeg.) TaxID=47850 RepID=UPI00340FB5B8
MTAPSMHASAEQAKPAKTITFKVDDESITTTEKDLTPNQILNLAGVDPASAYLVEVKGRHQESYEGRGDTPIRVHAGDTFVSVSTGPTPTS